jgi:DNA-nicking Smr family endonuclease
MSRKPPLKQNWHPPLNPNDVALWEDIKKTVKRLPKAAPKKEKLVVAEACKEKPEVSAPNLEKKPVAKTAKPYTPSAPSSAFDRATLRKIKTGRIAIDDRLDLHGMRQDAAHRALTGFIFSAHRHGYKLVLVITGKGDRFSKSEGVLRAQLPRWLKETELSRAVLSFSKASIPHGGEGAFYVRLRKLIRS